LDAIKGWRLPEAEELSDLAITGRGGDVLDVNGSFAHDGLAGVLFGEFGKWGNGRTVRTG
jgi:hypothetical protein